MLERIAFDMNLNKYLKEFLESKRAAGRSPETLKFYDGGVKLFLRFCRTNGYSGADLVGSIGAEVVEDYLVHLRERDLSPASIATYYRALRGLYRWIEKRHGFNGQECPFDLLSEPRTPDKLPKRISAAEVDMILYYITPQGPHDWLAYRDKLIVQTLFSFGMRAGELIRLRIDDVDLDRRLLRVERQKTHNDDFVPFTHSLRRLFKEWIEEIRPAHPSRALWLTPLGGKTSQVDNSLTVSGLNQMLLRRCKAAGLPNYRAHSFRHGCAVHTILNGGDLVLVKDLLGHARIETAQIYTKFDTEEITRRYDQVWGS